MASTRWLGTALVTMVAIAGTGPGIAAGASAPGSAGPARDGVSNTTARGHVWRPSLTGVLRDRTGDPTDGVVAMYAVHADATQLSFEPLDQAVVGAGGSFRLALAGSTARRVRALGDQHDGYVNVAVAGIAADGQGISFTTLVDPVRHVARAAEMRPMTLRAKRTLRRGDRGRAAAIRAALQTSGTQPAGYHPSWCNYQVAQTWTLATTVGELHAMPNMSAKFTYGQGSTADSDISVAVNAAGGNGGYSLDGSVHVTSSSSAEISRTRSSTYGKILKSNFKYARYHKPGTAYPVDCLAADDDYALAYQWAGGWTEGSDVTGLDNSCTKGARSNEYDSTDTFTRSSNTLKNWSGAVTLLGLGLKAASGASSRVNLHYEFNGTSTARHQLCGDNDDPVHSDRIFVDNDWT